MNLNYSANWNYRNYATVIKLLESGKASIVRFDNVSDDSSDDRYGHDYYNKQNNFSGCVEYMGVKIAKLFSYPVIPIKDECLPMYFRYYKKNGDVWRKYVTHCGV